MANIKINDVPQRIQYEVATPTQSVFPVPFPFLANTDIVVWQDDVQLAQGSGAGQYGLSGAGTASGGTMTLVDAASTGAIITITGETPIDRTSIYSPTISNLTGDDLNSDLNRIIIMLQELWTVQNYMQLQYFPWLELSQDITVTTDRMLPILPAGCVWQKNQLDTAIIATSIPEIPVGIEGEFTADNRLVRTNLPAGGNFIQQSGVTLNDADVMTGVASIQIAGVTYPTNTPAIGQAIVANSPTTSVWSSVGTGNVVGPVSSTDNAIARFDGITGELIQNSSVIVDDSGNMTGVESLNINSSTTITGVIDDDTFATASAVTVPTSESTKAYVDAQVAGAGTVDSVVGTANQVDVNSADPAHPVISLSSTIIAPGSVAVTALTAKTAVIANASKELTSVALTDGQLLIGSTGNVPVAASITAGSGVTVTPSAGGITIAATGSGGTVTSVSGTTNQINSTGGATPVLSLSSTAIAPGSLAVTALTASTALVANSSKELTSVALTNGQLLIGSTGAAPVAASLTAGTGVTITPSAGGITIATTGGSGVTVAVSQSNSFTGGEWVYLNGSTYTLASNAAAASAEVVGVVAFSPAPTGSTFTLQTNGSFTGSSGLTAGVVYFLGTGGALTATPPTTVGTIVKPLLVANSTTSGVMINFRGEINAAPSFPYDLAFIAGFNTSGSGSDVAVQTYGQLVMARTGGFTGDVGVATTAPTGAAMILDIEKNGTTIYTSKPQFAISATTMTNGVLKSDGTQNFVSGDVITFKITQIGSTVKGQGVKFTLTGLI